MYIANEKHRKVRVFRCIVIVLTLKLIYKVILICVKNNDYNFASLSDKKIKFFFSIANFFLVKQFFVDYIQK